MKCVSAQPRRFRFSGVRQAVAPNGRAISLLRFHANREYGLQIVSGEDLERNQRFGASNARNVLQFVGDDIGQSLIVPDADDCHQVHLTGYGIHFADAVDSARV